MNIGSHHLHLRKRMYENLEPFPHPQKLQRYFDRVMYAVGVLAPFALIPQVLQIYVYRHVGGLSATSFALLGSINVLWICYAVLHRERPIFVANIGMMLLNFSIVAGIFLFR